MTGIHFSSKLNDAGGDTSDHVIVYNTVHFSILILYYYTARWFANDELTNSNYLARRLSQFLSLELSNQAISIQ